MQNRNMNKETKYSELEKALKKVKSSFIAIGVYSFFLNILMLSSTIYMLAVYDVVMPSKSLDTLLVVTLVILIFFVGMALLEYVRSKIMLHVSNKLDALLNRKIFDATFELAIRNPGKANAAPMRDFNTVKQFLTGSAVFAVFDAPWFPIYLAIMFVFDPVYGFYGLGATAIIIILTILNGKATKKGLEHSNNMYQKSVEHFSNTVRNVEVVEAMGMKRALFKKWMEKHFEYIETHTQASSVAAMYNNASKTFRMMASSLMYGVGALLAIGGHISPGMIIAGAVLLGRALAPISQLVASWKTFSSARISYKRLNELLLEFDEIEERISLPEPEGKIEFQNIVVVPPLAQKPVLKNISFTINPGESVGVIGPSAAGKSTLAKAAVGVWPVVNGSVRIDGADIKHYNRDELGEHIGYLPQDIELFEGTIAENIARFRSEDPQKIIEAAKLSGTHDLILNLPNGYESRVGPGGASLSGGQKQRIGLARAVYGMPKMVILDEPNSNLDDAGEYALMMALRVLKQRGTTLLFITHRKNLLALADKIAVVKDGMLSLYGPRDEVLTALSPNAQNNQAQKKAVENKE